MNGCQLMNDNRMGFLFDVCFIRCFLCLFLALGAVKGVAAESLSTDELAERMDDARQAMIEAQYDRAILTYRELLVLPEHPYLRDALELLGLAYERKGDFKQAQQEYRRYLQLYPKGDGSERVKQRLAGLETALWEAGPTLKAEKKRTRGSEWHSYGVLAQYLRRDVSSYDDDPSVVNQYGLTTLIDVTTRRRTDTWDIKSRVSADMLHEIEDGAESGARVKNLYMDISRRQQGLSFKLGRQNAYGGGVLGRYDGLNLGWRFSPQYRVGVIYGMPVQSTVESLDRNTKFYGVNLETGLWANRWEINGYYIEQKNRGAMDRQALGAEVRYLHSDVNVYSIIDYDIYFRSLNLFSTQGSWVTSQKDIYTFILDYRNAPPIATSNALIGQTVQTLSELRLIYSEAQIKALAEDRTPQSTIFMVGYTHNIRETLRWNIDVSANRISSMPASGGVEEVPSNGVGYYISTQFTATNIWHKGDSHIAGLGVNSSGTSNTATVFINSLFMLGDKWYVNPRLSFSYDYYDNGDSRETISPGMKIDYRIRRYVTLEFDSGYESGTQYLWYGEQKIKSYFFDIGYRVNF